MHRNHVHRTLSGSAILLAILACALPSQTLQPAPVTDPNAISTFIAGTSRAVAKQTEQASPVASTPILVPTETLAPIAAISSYGTSLTTSEDGSSQFIDYRAGVQILFPSNWLAMRAGEPEYYEAWEKNGAQNPYLLDAITSIQNIDLNTFRVTAYDIHPEHILYDNLPKINVVFIQDDKRTLKEVEVDERKRVSPLAEHKFLPSDFQETPGGLQSLVIQHQWKSSNTHREYMSLYKGILFKVPAGTVALDLFIPFDQQDVIWPEYDQIIGSITLFTP
jgi:hypothetical protein